MDFIKEIIEEALLAERRKWRELSPDQQQDIIDELEYWEDYELENPRTLAIYAKDNNIDIHNLNFIAEIILGERSSGAGKKKERKIEKPIEKKKSFLSKLMGK